MNVLEEFIAWLIELIKRLLGLGSTKKRPQPTYIFTVSPTEVALGDGEEVRLLVRSLRHVQGERDEKVDFTIRDLGALPRWLSAKITYRSDGYDTITLKHTEDYE